MLEIIEKKRDQYELSKEEIEFFVKGYNEGSIQDYQASALLMAIYINKMSDRETADLTMAMSKTGETIDLSKIRGIKVDKHSSGGVGDKTTLVVGPMVAACGLSVAKMSGRGLGFGGGTIDKLESIEGFRTDISQEEFVKFVNEDQISIMGQSKNIAPADKKIYALRDVTGTVEDMALIASSIMSKKLACNSDAIVLDVKVGSGAFMKTMDQAIGLAQKMVSIGMHNGKDMVAAITNMDEPLGHAVGNGLEIKEVIDSLNGKGPADFMEVCRIIGSLMLVKGKKADTIEEAQKMLTEVLDNKAAFKKFLKFVENQGGNTEVLLDSSKLPQAQYMLPIIAKKSGFVTKICGETIGNSTLVVGAGRYDKVDKIDYAAGAVVVKKVGDEVKAGDVLAYIHSNDEEKGAMAVEMAQEAYRIGEKTEKKPMLFAIVDKGGVHPWN